MSVSKCMSLRGSKCASTPAPEKDFLIYLNAFLAMSVYTNSGPLVVCLCLRFWVLSMQAVWKTTPSTSGFSIDGPMQLVPFTSLAPYGGTCRAVWFCPSPFSSPLLIIFSSSVSGRVMCEYLLMNLL